MASNLKKSGKISRIYNKSFRSCIIYNLLKMFEFYNVILKKITIDFVVLSDNLFVCVLKPND